MKNSSGKKKLIFINSKIGYKKTIMVSAEKKKEDIISY